MDGCVCVCVCIQCVDYDSAIRERIPHWPQPHMIGGQSVQRIHHIDHKMTNKWPGHERKTCNLFYLWWCNHLLLTKFVFLNHTSDHMMTNWTTDHQKNWICRNCSTLAVGTQCCTIYVLPFVLQFLCCPSCEYSTICVFRTQWPVNRSMRLSFQVGYWRYSRSSRSRLDTEDTVDPGKILCLPCPSPVLPVSKWLLRSSMFFLHS